MFHVHAGDHSLSSASTRGLFYSLIVLTLAAPCVSAIVFFSYMYASDTAVTRADIKQLAMVTWVVTLLALAGFAFHHRRYGAPADGSADVPIESGALRAEAWEGRRSRRYIRNLLICGAATCTLLAGTLYGFAPRWFLRLNGADRIQVIAGAWLLGLGVLLLVAIRLGRRKLVYRTPK